MTDTEVRYDILKDDLSGVDSKGPAVVTLGEVMVRDTPSDCHRLESTRAVHLSPAGSEYTLAVALSRLGIRSSYITRVPDNPYGWMIRDIARGLGVNTDHFVWADRTEPIGRLLYELGRTPRRSTGWYQRRHSAATKLGAADVDWTEVTADARILHTSGISFGLAVHSDLARNHLLEAFCEGVRAKPEGCMVGLDFNYRSTLWSPEECREVMTPFLVEHTDLLITTIEDMATIYSMGCGRFNADEIARGGAVEFSDDELKSFLRRLLQEFDLTISAVTIRYPDSFERHRWESVVLDEGGDFFRSPRVSSIRLWDRLGGGDTWNGGFYYGLLTERTRASGLEKGLLVGDAATRLKQTLMFDLPIVTKEEIQALMVADAKGGGRRTVR